jgi:hypothetical protein
MPKIFQISQGDAGFSFNGVNYTFSDVDTIDYTYNRKNHLTRGASGTNKLGIAYKEGLKTPDAAEVKVVDCSVAIYKLLLTIFNDSSRINFWFIDRATGEGFTYKNAPIRDKPRQTSIGESEDAIGFMFAVESFDVTEKINDE